MPDATDKSKLSCPRWSPDIYQGKSGSLFRVVLNRPMAEFIFGQAKLTTPALRANLTLVEDWGAGDTISGEGGFTGITKDESEQNVIICELKYFKKPNKKFLNKYLR